LRTGGRSEGMFCIGIIAIDLIFIDFRFYSFHLEIS